MNILDDMGVSKLSAKVFFFKVNYSFKDRFGTGQKKTVAKKTNLLPYNCHET